MSSYVVPVTRVVPADDGAYSALRRDNETALSNAGLALEVAAGDLLDAGDVVGAMSAYQAAAVVWERVRGLNSPEAVQCRAYAARAHELT